MSSLSTNARCDSVSFWKYSYKYTRSQDHQYENETAAFSRKITKSLLLKAVWHSFYVAWNATKKKQKWFWRNNFKMHCGFGPVTKRKLQDLTMKSHLCFSNLFSLRLRKSDETPLFCFLFPPELFHKTLSLHCLKSLFLSSSSCWRLFLSICVVLVPHSWCHSTDVHVKI